MENLKKEFKSKVNELFKIAIENRIEGKVNKPDYSIDISSSTFITFYKREGNEIKGIVSIFLEPYSDAVDLKWFYKDQIVKVNELIEYIK